MRSAVQFAPETLAAEFRHALLDLKIEGQAVSGYVMSLPERHDCRLGHRSHRQSTGDRAPAAPARCHLLTGVELSDRK